MLYYWAIIAVLLVWGIARAIRWWNLPEVAEARTKRVIERQRQRSERLKIRRREKWIRLFQRQHKIGLRSKVEYAAARARVLNGDYDNQEI